MNKVNFQFTLHEMNTVCVYVKNASRTHPPLREVNPISKAAAIGHPVQVEVVGADAGDVGVGGPMVEQK